MLGKSSWHFFAPDTPILRSVRPKTHMYTRVRWVKGLEAGWVKGVEAGWEKVVEAGWVKGVDDVFLAVRMVGYKNILDVF